MRVPLQIVMVYQNTILGFIKLAFVYEWMAFSNLGVEENLLTEPELLPELWPKKLGCYLWSVTVGSSSILIVLAASFPSAIVFCMKFSQERSMGKETGPDSTILYSLFYTLKNSSLNQMDPGKPTIFYLYIFLKISLEYWSVLKLGNQKFLDIFFKKFP